MDKRMKLIFGIMGSAALLGLLAAGCAGTDADRESEPVAASLSAFTTGHNCWDCWQTNGTPIPGCPQAIRTCDDILRVNPFENCELSVCSDAPTAEDGTGPYAMCYFVGCESDPTKMFVRESTPYCRTSDGRSYYHFVENGCVACPKGQVRNPSAPWTCKCSPLSQVQACGIYQCGTASDGCGGTYSCGTCIHATCGADHMCTCSTGYKDCGDGVCVLKGHGCP